VFLASIPVYADTVVKVGSTYELHPDASGLLTGKLQKFHIKLIKGRLGSNYMVYAKEDLGAIIAKTSAPSVVIAVNETNLTAAFWDFLNNTIDEKGYKNPNKVEETNGLKEYIQRIRNS
jgi:hypothetical protein